MCMSWTCLFSIMSLKIRKFSLDSSVCLDGVGGGRRGSSRCSSKKCRQSLVDARLEIQKLNHSLNSNMSLRKQTISEDNLERSEGLINNHRRFWQQQEAVFSDKPLKTHVHYLLSTKQQTDKSFLKHNKSFHKLFPEISEGENLTHSFTCALQKEVLYHGKLFVSETHVCFHSSVLLKDTKVVIPASSVREVKKHNSALSMLSIQTADGEKCSFVSLRHREMCYKLLQTVCKHAQGKSSPHLSSAENEADHEMASSYSSLEDCGDHDLSRQHSIPLDNSFPQMSSEGPTRSNSTRHSSLTDEDDRAQSWIWRIIEKVTPFFFLREMRNLSVLFYIYMMLTVLLMLASAYIGLRIIALEEQLNSLGALTELPLHHGEYQKT
ncbi:GRAM domain-containing protein 2A-like isoform X2 [Siniperca chuatsi]|uniref:GRAM domain-containing protein 2A-like isoform X2 n=1 Tax=Siniperca chuatsi TaxID=119488 RepID=UPI001CE07197|nr:GRAM domain-containing protein 2A-like isoform X2 [Siniperca chuatsi]